MSFESWLENFLSKIEKIFLKTRGDNCYVTHPPPQKLGGISPLRRPVPDKLVFCEFLLYRIYAVRDLNIYNSLTLINIFLSFLIYIYQKNEVFKNVAILKQGKDKKIAVSYYNMFVMYSTVVMKSIIFCSLIISTK